MRIACSVLAVLLPSLGLPARAEDPTAPAPLDARAEAAVVEYARGVADDLLGVLRGDAEARDALEERALDPAEYADGLARFVRATTAEGEVAGVDPAGFDLDVVLRYGFVPVGAAELHFYVGPGGVRLVRLRSHPTDEPLLGFARSRGTLWQGDVGEAFGYLARDVLDAAVQGRCETLPMLAPDTAGAFPDDPDAASRMRETLARMEGLSVRSCRQLTGRLFDRLTWRLGRLSAVVTLAGGRKLPFEQELVAGPDGRVRLGPLALPRR